MANTENEIQLSAGDGSLFRHNIKEELKRCQNQGQVVSIYSDREAVSKFAAGFVRAVDNEFVLLAHITPFGAYDGFRIKKLEKIYKVEYGGKYENKIQQLYDIQKQQHPDVATTGSVVIDLLSYAQENDLFISAELLDSGYDDVQGLVLGIKDDTLMVREFDEFGDEDGTCIVDIRNITIMECDSDDEAALRLLIEK